VKKIGKAGQKIVQKTEKVAPDVPSIIEGVLLGKLEKKELQCETILIHNAIVAWLEHQAADNKAAGQIGIDELKKIRDFSNTVSDQGLKIEFAGRTPAHHELMHIHISDLNTYARELAYENDATFFTCDKMHAKVAMAKGTNTILVELDKLQKKIMLEKFFDETTMSVHLRENVSPGAKKGRPGAWTFSVIRDKKLTRDEVQEISREIIEEAGLRKDGFVEIERPGSTIVQLGKFRTVITKPPFSDGWEITAVRPVKKLSLSDYKLSEKLMKRISEQAEGILIAGAPGHGKSTFATGLAEFYAGQNKIIKTIEAPRDLVLPDSITQYAISHGDAQEVHDVLLLSRPDYTIFDEMRNTEDFRLFADLRLAGIGLAGVVHATNPVDAIQRFVGRIELGVIPQVIDTVIFIKDGIVFKVLSLQMVVKVPSGMTEADLARPVVVVTDFETRKLEFELYSYGEETVVVPVRGKERSPAKELAAKQIEQEFKNFARKAKAEVISDVKCYVYVPEDEIARIIGKQGKNIEEIEKQLGINIEIKPLTQNAAREEGKEMSFDAKITKSSVELDGGGESANTNVDIFVEESYLLTVRVGAKGIVKISKDNKIGKILVNAITMGEKIRVKVSQVKQGAVQN